MKGISVIVCCFNSETRLPETIKHLALQEVKSSFPWEVIIVDNASTDNTKNIAASEWIKLKVANVNLKVINEAKQGLSYARQRGVEEASFEYIIFCDDDNWFEENYLEQAFNIINSNNKIGAAGGRSIAVSDVEFPDWFEKYKHGYAVGNQSACSGEVSERGYIWGAGLITRKKLFLSTFNDKYPSLLTDRKGNSITSGGDSEYCQRLILKKYKLYYSESLIFKHYISANRLSEEYRKKLFESFDESNYYLSKYYQAIEIKKLSTYRKFILINATITDFFIKKLKGEKLKQSSFIIFYYLLNIDCINDKDLKLIKHFYNI